MFSDVIQAALDREIAGQTRAINSVVRGATRAASGLFPREGPLCAYMFMGPTGTGKTQIVRTLARALHGNEDRLVIADCTHFAQGDPWLAFVAQLAPMFAVPRMGHDSQDKWSVLEAPPLSIVLIEYLERGRPEVVKALVAALETGTVTLPEGRRGSLRNCMVFITSSLCAQQILEGGARIGFSGSAEEELEGQVTLPNGDLDDLYKACATEATKHYGPNLMGRLDALIVFHRLEEEHLCEILERMILTMNQSLSSRGFSCDIRPEARSFLLERGRRDLRQGARNLVRAHRRFVEFPVADLMVSGRIPPGGHVIVDRRKEEENLHFTIDQPDERAEISSISPDVREVVVA